MNDAWQKTKEFAENKKGKRKEYGFCMYVNTETSDFEIDHPFQEGNAVSCGTIPSISLYPHEGISSNPAEGGKYLVAVFHTHTPLDLLLFRK